MTDPEVDLVLPASTMSDGFPYRCVAVLGASAGLGRALASAIHDLPTTPRVIATARRADRLDELVREKGSDRLIARAYDQSVSTADLQQWVADLLRDEPDLDCVVFMAGIQHGDDLADPSKIDLRAEFEMNFFSVVSGISAFTPHFRELGKASKPCAFVTVTSGLAIVPNPWNGLYSASKGLSDASRPELTPTAALRSYTLSLRSSLKPHGVKVIEILPPLVESELHDHQGTTAVRHVRILKSCDALPSAARSATILATTLLTSRAGAQQVLDAAGRVHADRDGGPDVRLLAVQLRSRTSAGREEIAVGQALQSYDKYEKGKVDEVQARVDRRAQAQAKR